MQLVNEESLEKSYTVCSRSPGQSYKNGRMVVCLPKTEKGLIDGATYAVQKAPFRLGSGGFKSRQVIHLLLAVPDPNSKFVWIENAGSSEAFGVKWETGYAVYGANFKSVECSGFFIKKPEQIIVDSFKAVDSDYFANRVNAARRIEFECNLVALSNQADLECGTEFIFKNQQTANIVAVLESVETSLESVETVEYNDGWTDYVHLYAYLIYNFKVDVPFSTPYLFKVEVFRKATTFTLKEFNKKYFKVKASHKEAIKEDDMTVSHLFPFPETSEFAKIAFSYDFDGQGGHKYRRATTCNFRQKETRELYSIDREKQITCYPNFCLVRPDGTALMSEGFETVTGKQLWDEQEAEKTQGRIDQLPSDWITVKFQNGTGTRRQGAKYLLVSDGEEIFVFGGSKDGILPQEGLFAVVETVGNYHGDVFTLKLSPKTKTAISYADDLYANGFDFDPNKGSWSVEWATPELISFFRLESKEDSDPLDLQGTSLNVPKNWGKIKGLLLSGGVMRIEGYCGSDRNAYYMRYYSMTNGDISPERAKVLFWEISTTELKRLKKEALDNTVIYE